MLELTNQKLKQFEADRARYDTALEFAFDDDEVKHYTFLIDYTGGMIDALEWVKEIIIGGNEND